MTRVPISRSTTFPLLKALGVASLGAGKRIRASTQAEVSASGDLVTLLSELPDHIPPGINVAAFDRFSAVQLPPPTLFQAVAHRRARRREPAGPERGRPATPTDHDRRTVVAAAERPELTTTRRTSISTAGTSAPASQSAPSTPASEPRWRWSPQMS